MALLGCAALAVAAGSTLGASPATASSHREAPAISGEPQYDATDVYAFLSPDKSGTVTLIANWLPFSEPAGGPNFYLFADDAQYDIRVDTNGDAVADVVYRWTFTTSYRNPGTFLYNTGPVTSLNDTDLNIRQKYTLKRWKNGAWTTIAASVPAAPSNVGTASMPDYDDLVREATITKGSYDLYAGQADDSFFLDLRVFDLLYGANLSEVGNDTLAGYNVNSVALRVPVSEFGGAGNVVGVWTTTQEKNSSGAFPQISRLGNPLVNEAVIPLKDKDKFNASRPPSDSQFADYVLHPGLPKVIQAVYGIPAPAEPRDDLVAVFLTGIQGLNKPASVKPSEMLRLNLTPFSGQTPSRLGVIGGDKNGYPNGRRLTDDVIDIALQVVEGELVGSPNDLGDGVNANDVPFESSFPYLAEAHSGSASVNNQNSPAKKPATLVSPLVGGKPDGASPVTSAVAATAEAASGLSRAAAAGAAGLVVTGSGAAMLVVLLRRRRGTAPGSLG